MPFKTNDFYLTSKNRSIAYSKSYHNNLINKPGVLFLGGFRSDMSGTKASFLEKWSKEKKFNFLKFDYSGHGKSSGSFESGCISDWSHDACQVLDELTEGPQILVGSSMGGWISLLLGKLRPQRVIAFIGIASAPDFTEDSMWANLDQKSRKELEAFGKIQIENKYSLEPYTISEKLIKDGRSNLIMNSTLEAPYSVRLLQGMQDEDVHFSTALRLSEHITHNDVEVILVKNADHQFSSSRCLEILKTTIEEFL